MVDGGGSMEGIKTAYKRGKHSNKYIRSVMESLLERISTN